MAFCWKFCGNMKVLFGLLLLFFILTEAKNCNYFENLKTGKTYYAYNPEYPNAIEGPLDCNWEMTSPYPIKIDCNISIPTKYSDRCGQDTLSVKFKDEKEQKYCGNGKFILEGINATIRLKISRFQKSSFICKIQISEAKNCYYFENLKTGKTYYAYNPEYPNAIEGPLDCNWEMTSPYPIKIDCNVSIPTKYKDRCGQDTLSVNFKDKKEQKYCGNGKFILEGINATIRLKISRFQKSSFICKIQTEEPFDENNCKCGWKKVTRIVGGNETGINEYPMMCGLVDKTLNMTYIYCGCTIISHQWVVTAAHCVYNKTINDIDITVGEHDVTTGSETKATKVFGVNKCEIHPDYNETKLMNDIAVCKIEGTIEYSAEVGPACLPFQHRSDSFGGATGTALGWGLLEFAGAKSPTLQKVELSVIKNCQKYYSDVTDENICTYTPGKDACQMDSGGPLLWQDKYNLVLIGIISNGVYCASNEPGIDTRVGAFIDWIESVTPDAQYCKKE